MSGMTKKIIKHEKIFKGEVDVKYVLFPAYKDSDLLTITFAGFHAEGDPPKYNYMRTLEEFDCHQLFILDDFGARGSYYLCVERDFKIERSIKKLIDDICEKFKIKKMISLGSSKGGSAAIYYGLKYNFEAIIAGAPQFHIGSYLKKVKSANNVLEFMAGNQDEESVEYIDNIMNNVIESKKECLSKVIICVGENDPHYQSHSAPLIAALEKNNIPFILDFLNYSGHSAIGKFFPDSIKKNLVLHGLFSILEDYNIEVEKKQIKLNLLTTDDNDKVAVYLYVDDKNGKKQIVERIGYSLEKKYRFNVDNHSNYTVKVFIIGSGKRRYATVLPRIIMSEFNPYLLKLKKIKDKSKKQIKKLKSKPKSKLHLMQQDKRVETITEIKSNTIEIANLILENQFYLNKGMDVIDFSVAIAWNYEHNKNKNSYQLYLHALHPISYLVNAFEVSEKLKYLEKAKSVLEDWLRYEMTNHENMFVWYDHAVANRTQTLIYYYLIAKEHFHQENDDFIKLIERHGEYLLDDQNYRKNNHGMMMDKALIMLGMVFDIDEAKGYVQKGLQRLRDSFHHSFSNKGVHLENSPEYHAFVHDKMFLSIEQYLNNNDLTLGKSVVDRFKLIDEYYSYITKPNGYFPMIGDTKDMKSPKNEKKFAAFYDQTAGISIFQSENPEDPSKSTWMSFICGFGTLTHKHYDDLSFTLAYKGKDIFIDSGKYGYGTSPERKYMRSPLAHSTIAVAGRDRYIQNAEHEHNETLASSSDDTIATTSFYDNNVYSYVKGINNGYKNIKMERNIFFFKPDILVIIDKARSTNNKKYTFLQNFNLDPHIKVNHVGEGEAQLQSEEDKIIIKQLFSLNDTKVHTANREVPRAVISRKSGQLIDTNQLEFSKIGKKVCFVSTISLGEGTQRNVLVDYKNDESILKITLDGESIDIIT